MDAQEQWEVRPGWLPVRIQVGSHPPVTVGEIDDPQRLPELLRQVSQQIRDRPEEVEPPAPGLASDLAAAMLASELRRRSPYERAQWLAEKRADLEQVGEPTEALDLAQEVLAAADRDAVAGLRRWAGLIVDAFAGENYATLAALPAAWATGLIVEMTVAFLYANGLVTSAVADAEPGWHPVGWREAVPEHLHPDVAGAVASFARMNARVGVATSGFQS